MAAKSPPRNICSPSVTLICFTAVQKILLTPLAASSAALFIDKIALSTMPPMPTPRKVFSTFCASAGIKILMAASPKKPLALLSFLLALSVPTLNASFKPLMISSLLKPLPVAEKPPDTLSKTLLPEVESFFVTLFIRPFKPCACISAISMETRRAVVIILFI